MPAARNVTDALQRGAEASKHWHDLAVEITTHATKIIANGQWNQLPEFEQQWLAKIIESLKEDSMDDTRSHR